MGGGSEKGVCGETRRHFYTNASDAPARLGVWVQNSGDCRILIEIAESPGGRNATPLDGVVEWMPGQAFLQSLFVPPRAHLLLRCGDAAAGGVVRSGGATCAFEWDAQLYG
jgi:hypothetical protein